MGEVLDLLGEPVSESGEPSHAHPHGEVLPFHIMVQKVLPEWWVYRDPVGLKAPCRSSMRVSPVTTSKAAS